MKTVVVIPTYNEAQNLPDLVGLLLRLDIENLHVLVVDDSSPDGTGAVADRLAQEQPGRVHTLHRRRKEGLGAAYVAGFQEALRLEPDLVVQMDADFSHPPEAVSRLVQRAAEADVVVGSRYVKGAQLDPTWGLSRRLLSHGGNAYARLVTGLRVRDATSGFKCFRRHVLEAIDLRTVRCKGFAFQTEVGFRCQRLGFRTVEEPIAFAERTRGRSKMSLRIIVEALWQLARLRFTTAAAR